MNEYLQKCIGERPEQWSNVSRTEHGSEEMLPALWSRVHVP